MPSPTLAATKERLLPTGTKLRRIPFGIGRGAIVPVDFVRHTRLYMGLYEVELNRHLRTLCTPGMPTFDVGAQLGYDALVLARLSRAPVISFEADHALAQTMVETFSANRDISNLLSARHATVARTSGDGMIALDDVAYGDGFVPGLIKLDIDGGEVEALKGAARLLREARPHMVIETHSLELERDCGMRLQAANYRPLIVHQRTLWPDHRPTLHNRWLVAAGSPQPPSSPRYTSA